MSFNHFAAQFVAAAWLAPSTWKKVTFSANHWFHDGPIPSQRDE
jgi:hypothetical protein